MGASRVIGSAVADRFRPPLFVSCAILPDAPYRATYDSIIRRRSHGLVSIDSIDVQPSRLLSPLYLQGRTYKVRPSPKPHAGRSAACTAL